MKQKTWIFITLGLFLVALIMQQLVFYKIGPLSGIGGLVITGGSAFILLVLLIIQLIVFLATRKRKK